MSRKLRVWETALRDAHQSLWATRMTREMMELGAHTKLKVLAVYGGQAINTQAEKLKKNPHIIVGTPGRVMDMHQRGLLPYDPGVVRYALPLAAIGGLIAFYHLLLQIGVIPESAAPCRQGVSCSEAQLQVLGFVSIPMLSLVVFAMVTGLLWQLKRRQSS